MRRVEARLAAVVLSMAAGSAWASKVAPGDLVILQSVGDSTVAAQTAVPVSLTEFSTSPNSAAVQTVNVPTAGAARLTIGAATATEGVLTYNDGYIGIAGYDADPGTAAVFSTATNSVRRMVAYDVTQDLSSGPQYNATTTIFNNGNFRSAIYSATAGGAYGIGALGGFVFQPNGGSGTGTNVVTNGTALQGVGIFNGNLYGYMNNGTHGIYEVPGLPTTGGSTQSLFTPTPQAANNSTAVTGYNFWISPDASTVYLAEDTDTASAAHGGLPTGGIKKYVRGTDGTFSLAYTISTDYDGDGSALTGVRSIAVDSSGASPLIYATTSDRQVLLSLTDTGTAAGAAATLSVLQSASAGNLIRSVVFVPHVPGDVDDNGVLDADDFALIDRGYNRYLGGQIASGQAVWADGDFNHDGAVNAGDYLILDTNYGATHALSPELLELRASEFGQDYVTALTAAVPEPGALPVAVIVAAGWLLRRGRSVWQTPRV